MQSGKKKLLQINVIVNSGSTGKIVGQIDAMAARAGWTTAIAYSRGTPHEYGAEYIRIGDGFDMRMHGLATRLFDRHGLASASATRRFIKEAERFDPDLIHLHNIHGYYLNYPLLFDYLQRCGKPVVWTLHDSWTFTGHCSVISDNLCDRWKTGCFSCPRKSAYPKSMFADRSRKNFLQKKESFGKILNRLTIVAPSQWLGSMVEESFLKDADIRVIHNGIDLEAFRPRLSSERKKLVLGVANVWKEGKGLKDFIKLRSLLPDDFEITLVGLTPKEISSLPPGITGIQRTENIEALADLYSKAAVFVNPSDGETLPTTNIESLACGTPVVTYAVGGTGETIDASTGLAVEHDDCRELAKAVEEMVRRRLSEGDAFSQACRRRAEFCFDKNVQFRSYIDLYEELTNE